jgi:NADH dehydrogenase [ubiquinone] 1 alpha subcomplex assembly factor 6
MSFQSTFLLKLGIRPYYSHSRNDFLTISWFYSELSRIEETTTQKNLAIGKLDFWAESIDSVFNDNPVKEPITICLHHTCKQNPLPKFLFQKMINARRSVVEKNGFTSMNDMALACEANKAPFFALILKLLRI